MSLIARPGWPAHPREKKYIFFDDFIGSGYDSRRWTLSTGGSIATQATVGGIILVRGNAASTFRMDFNNIAPFTSGSGAHIVWRGAMQPATAASGKVSCGFSEYVAPTTDWARWVYEPNASANFRCACTYSGSTTTESSGVAGDTANHRFEIQMALNSAKFYLDGVLTNTITANVISNYMQPFVSCTGSAAATSDFLADYVWAQGGTRE